MSNDVMVAALQSQVAGLKVALTQANQIVAKLMGKSLTEEQRNELFQKVLDHLVEQDTSRSTQLSAVISTAGMQLNSIALVCSDPEAKASLVEVIKALALVEATASFKVESRKVSNEH